MSATVARSVPCPWCGATGQASCRTSDGQLRVPHRARQRMTRAAKPRLSLALSWPEWCGECNEFTRLIDSTGDGPFRRCTACHPLAEEAS